MIRVAFIDHHLNNWHADTFLRLLHGPLESEGLQVVSAWESNPVGDDWCAKTSVPRASTLEGAVESADVVFLLAPDNIEDHLALARRVLPFGKPTLIDKFLSHNPDDALEIVGIAEASGARIFSSSSLRFSVELEALLPEIRNGTVSDGRFTGIGQWYGYGVHTVCLALRVMGWGVKRLIHTGTEEAATVTLDYEDGRRALVDMRHVSNQYESLTWEFGATVDGKWVGTQIRDFDGFYMNLMRNTAAFCRGETVDMTVEEALATVRVLWAGTQSINHGGKWFDV